MGLTALDSKVTGNPFGLTNYDNLKADIDWLIAGETVFGTNTSPASTTATSFAAGADLLASELSFTADGTSDYLVTAIARNVEVSAAAAYAEIALNLDGSESGSLGEYRGAQVNDETPLSASILLVAPSAGAHTVNVRIYAVNAATISVFGSTSAPILVMVRRLN